MSAHHSATKRRAQFDAAWRHALEGRGDQVPSRCPAIPSILSHLDMLDVPILAFLAALLRPTADEATYFSERRNNQRWREATLEKLLSYSVNVAQREILLKVLRAQRGGDEIMSPMPTRDISRGEMEKRKRQRWAALLDRFPFTSVPKALEKEASLVVWQDWKNGRAIPSLADVGIVCDSLGIHHDDAWHVFDPETYGGVSTESEQRSRRRTQCRFLSGWPDVVRLAVMSKDAIQARRLETRAYRKVQTNKLRAERRAAETQKALDGELIAEMKRSESNAPPVVAVPVGEMAAPFSIEDLLNEVSPPSGTRGSAPA